MKLENRFTVPVPVDQAWRVLLDVERIAPCMPGATLTNVVVLEVTPALTLTFLLAAAVVAWARLRPTRQRTESPWT